VIKDNIFFNYMHADVLRPEYAAYVKSLDRGRTWLNVICSRLFPSRLRRQCPSTVYRPWQCRVTQTKWTYQFDNSSPSLYLWIDV